MTSVAAASNEEGPVVAGNRRGSWRAELLALWRSRGGSARDELRALALVASVVVSLDVLERTVEFAVINVPALNLATIVSEAWDTLVMTSMIALAMFVIIEPVRRLGPAQGARRVAAIAGALAVATCIAVAIQTLFVLAAGVPADMTVFLAKTGVVRYALPAAFLVALGEFHRREIQSLEAMRAAEADRSELEQQTLQARLKTLEAQIEPHFLFNTLANVRRLYEVDPTAGDAMLDRMMRYLEVALPSMRRERVTLGREAELIEAYLDLQKVRMGRRLAFAIDIAPALGAIEVPPMMLLTLVENAIKHGLAPQRDGGRVDIAARLDGKDLTLEVADTGRGFGSDVTGGGTGLANIQVRLAAMFGSAAELTLCARQPHGVQATIRMRAALA